MKYKITSTHFILKQENGMDCFHLGIISMRLGGSVLFKIKSEDEIAEIDYLSIPLKELENYLMYGKR